MNRHLDTVFDLRHADLQSFDSDLYARCADQAVQEISDTELLALIATLQGIFRDAAEAAVHLGDDDSPFWSVASYLQREAPTIVRSVQEGFRDYAQLVRLWPRLIEGVSNLTEKRRAKLEPVLLS
jgi:hypothetical protein